MIWMERAYRGGILADDVSGESLDDGRVLTLFIISLDGIGKGKRRRTGS